MLSEEEIQALIVKYSLDEPVSSPAPYAEPFAYSRKLQYGDNGALVEQLQSRLRPPWELLHLHR